MNRCLDVGIRGVCDSYRGGNFVDDIHGISRLLVHGLKGSDLASANDYFKEIQDEAYLSFKMDLMDRFGKFKKFNSIVAETRPFKHSKVKNAIVDGLSYGYLVEMPMNEISYLQIDSIGLSVYRAGNVEFGIYNVSTSQIEFQQTYAVSGAECVVELNLRIDSEFGSQYLVYLRPLDAILTEMNCNLFSDKCGCYEAINTFTKPVNFAPDCDHVYNECGLTSMNFCLKAGLHCDFDKLICNYSTQLITAYKYKVGLSLLMHRISTSNRGTVIEGNKEEIKQEIIPMVQDHYERRIKEVVRQLKSLMEDSVCWTCDEEIAIPLAGSYV